jgi:hypothetical protein
VQLTAGDSYIVASQGGADFTGFVGQATFDPSISYVADAFAFDLFSNANDPLTYPDLHVGLLPGVSGWYGGNIILASQAPSGDGPGFSPSTAVPEASTWAMMLLGFAGLGFAGFRNRAKAALA